MKLIIFTSDTMRKDCNLRLYDLQNADEGSWGVKIANAVIFLLIVQCFIEIISQTFKVCKGAFNAKGKLEKDELREAVSFPATHRVFQDITVHPMHHYPDHDNMLISNRVRRHLDTMGERGYLTYVLNQFSPAERKFLMLDERERRRTFQVDWPHRDNLSGVEMARAGFYCIDIADRVKCAFCGGGLHDWDPCDDPMEEHERLYPFCLFVKNLDCGNIEYRGDLITSEDLKEIEDLRIDGTENIAAKCLEFGISTSRAFFAEFAPEVTRLKTFAKWPLECLVSSKSLCETGFYYTGSDDKVQCFFCAIIVRAWKGGDDPWTEHEKWSPECILVQQRKMAGFQSTASPCNGQERTSAYESARIPTGETKIPSKVNPQVLDQQAMEELCLKLGHEKNVIDEVMKLNDGVPYDTPRDMIEMLYKVEDKHLSIKDDADNKNSMTVEEEMATKNEHNWMRPAETESSMTVFEINSDSFAQEQVYPLPFRQCSQVEVDTAVENERISSRSPSAHVENFFPPVKKARVDAGQETQSLVANTGDGVKTLPQSTDQAITCKVCQMEDMEATYIGLPCGHLICCEGCKKQLKANKNSQPPCPVKSCSQTLNGLMRVHMC